MLFSTSTRSRLWAALAALIIFPACTTLQRPSAPEVAYQILAVADMSQTLTIARSPSCYAEGDPITRRLTGEHPSQRSVIATWAAVAALHYAVSGWLEREADATDGKGWRVALGVWRGASIAVEGYAVAHNASIGLRPFGGPASGCR